MKIAFLRPHPGIPFRVGEILYALVSFNILKLKFEFIGDELWFVKVKHFKMNARSITSRAERPTASSSLVTSHARLLKRFRAVHTL